MDKILNKIVEDINNFEDFQKIEIIKLIQNNNIKHSINKNGLFLNMRTLSIEHIELLQNRINYIKDLDKIDLNNI